ncbi:MAG: DinB family protein [Gemmataceae bacterium]|nr:DinB family protein [Gemmata sp.]MDW8196358.1 DinB family protein [Gemmataceae bacterium]
MNRLREALDQLDFTRRYTLERLESVPLSAWFTIPPGGVSHIAWQVGHIAMAEYLLCLARLRPRSAADEALIPDSFLQQFGRQSDPAQVTGISAEQIRDVYHRVHAQVMAELPHYPDADLDLPVLRPHPLFTTRLASLRYAPLHEMLHCGQIALIRRMLGYQPIW